MNLDIQINGLLLWLCLMASFACGWSAGRRRP
jgi:hypothetical protein